MFTDLILLHCVIPILLGIHDRICDRARAILLADLRMGQPFAGPPGSKFGFLSQPQKIARFPPVTLTGHPLLK